MPGIISFGTILAVLAVIFLIVIILTGYIKAPPDQAYIVSGLKKDSRVIIGKASVKVPFFERLDKLNLKLIPVDIKTSTAVPTADYININVDAAVNVKISNEEDRLKLAAQNFLNQPTEYIADIAREVLEGNMREIVGRMNLQEMVGDRQKFAELVKENAGPDLAAMGLDVVSFNVQNFTDSNGIIDDLGIDNITKIKKNAAIAKAESERDIEIAQAAANKEANDARVKSETEIAIKNNEMVIRKAELKRSADVKMAEADAAYEIQQQEQRKTIEVTSSNADIAKREKEAELAEREILLQEKRLDAEIKKKADAEKYRAEQMAEAELIQRKKEAEAKRYEQEQQALAKKAEADALKYAMEREAEGIRAKGLAEAEAIEKKAEAQKVMGEASILEMYLAALPEVVKNASLPLAKTDRIVMYGESNPQKLVGDVMNTTSQVSEALREATGIDLKEIINGLFRNGKENETA
ncbi:MAG: flotillin family protein [Christensenellaceae bacterium]|nr:flotillin family protein [Christensenellaceae bacterium]